jgi:valyl-tRNA synthetase
VELATAADRWIFSRLASVGKDVAGLYEAYEFDDVARLLYRFVWNELCDWYLEVAKSRLYSDDEGERLQVSGNLLVLLEHVMILLHPLMPFVTEEVYGFLPQVVAGDRPTSVFDARYPEAPAEWEDPQAEAAMEAFTAVVGGLRSTREELGLARDVVGKVHIVELSPGAAAAMVELKQAFRQLSGCDLSGVFPGGAIPVGRFAHVRSPVVRALLDLEGLVNVERERERLAGKAQKARAEIDKSRAKLGNPDFMTKAPAAVVEELKVRLAVAVDVLNEVRLQYQERIGGELPPSEGKKP